MFVLINAHCFYYCSVQLLENNGISAYCIIENNVKHGNIKCDSWHMSSDSSRSAQHTHRLWGDTSAWSPPWMQCVSRRCGPEACLYDMTGSQRRGVHIKDNCRMLKWRTTETAELVVLFAGMMQYIRLSLYILLSNVLYILLSNVLQYIYITL